MTLAQPLWLFALILLPLIAVGGILAARRQARRWGALVAGRLREHLIRRASPIPRWLAFGFLLAAIAAILGGLARPRVDGGTRTEKSVGRNLLLALDLSRSMRVGDVQPDRLALAKLVIFELLDAMPSERIGLIGFAGNPYLYAPLTIDHAAVRETVEQMDETWPTLGGSDLGEAVRLGIETLKKTGQRNNAMVILTDGEKHQGDIEQMASEAREAGVYILTIGVGTEDGDYVPHPDFPDKRLLDRSGDPVISRLQSEVLTELARETRGAYAQAGSGADIPAMVGSAIRGLDAYEMEGRERHFYIEYFQWLVLPAILLLIASLVAGTRWRGVAPLTAGICLLWGATTPRMEAAPGPDPKQAAAALDYQRYRQLAQDTLFDGRRARYRLGEAGAAYRLQTWNLAARAYSEALKSGDPEVRTAAHHGLGNVLFQKGWLCFLDKPYRLDDAGPPPMLQFESAVRAGLAEMKRGGRVREVEEEQPEPLTYSSIERAIVHWSDAARHYQSVLALQPGHAAARHNHELTLRYLRRLQELLQDDEQQTLDSMPDPVPEPDGEGETEPGDQGDPNSEGEAGDGEQNPQPGDQGREPGDRDNPPSTDPGEERKQPGDTQPDDSPPDQADNVRPGESPEERARRILRDNADLEKGPLTPGTLDFRRPEKDW